MPVEIERKLSLPERARVTSIEGYRLSEPRRYQLHAVYFDTPGFTLAKNRITLRRRTGGEDAAWHLKLPGDGSARTEIHEPIVRGQSLLTVPAVLRQRVADIVGYQPLVPIVTLRTRRTVRDILTPRGRRLAELCDDTVTATHAGDVRHWRELEVELTGGDVADLDAIVAVLVAQGASLKDTPSKLVQALGEDLGGKVAKLGRRSSAAQVVGAYIAEQIGVIQGREAEVRADAPDAVHKMRVGTRRLRSTLRTFRPLLDADRTEPIRAELKWLGERLGEPRDAEVMKKHLLGAVADLEPQAVVGPVERRLRTELDATHDAALGALRTALDSARARRLGDALVGLLTDPPFLDAAQGKARPVLGPLLRHAGRRVTKRWRLAEKAAGDERQLLAHEARKKAKAARYGWEAVAVAFAQGEKAASAWEDVTEVLGQAQDSVVARERLIGVAAAARKAGEPDFTYGVLWQRERDEQAAALHVASDAIRSAVKASQA